MAKSYNSGNLAEAIFACTVAKSFIQDDQDLDTGSVTRIIKEVCSEQNEESGPSTINGHWNSNGSDIELSLVVAKGELEALQRIDEVLKEDKTVMKALTNSISYTKNTIPSNITQHKIKIVADGYADQLGEKADITISAFNRHEETLNRKVSLKLNAKQIAQFSGGVGSQALQKLGDSFGVEGIGQHQLESSNEQYLGWTVPTAYKQIDTTFNSLPVDERISVGAKAITKFMAGGERTDDFELTFLSGRKFKSFKLKDIDQDVLKSMKIISTTSNSKPQIVIDNNVKSRALVGCSKYTVGDTVVQTKVPLSGLQITIEHEEKQVPILTVRPKVEFSSKRTSTAKEDMTVTIGDQTHHIPAGSTNHVPYFRNCIEVTKDFNLIFK